MIRQYKVKEINRTPTLHKKVFVLFDDVTVLLEKIIDDALKAGADPKKLKELIDE